MNKRRFGPIKRMPMNQRIATASVLRDSKGKVCSTCLLLPSGKSVFDSRDIKRFWRAILDNTKHFDILMVADIDRFGGAAFLRRFGFPKLAFPTLSAGGRILSWRIKQEKKYRLIVGISDHLPRSLANIDFFQDWFPETIAPIKLPLAYSEGYEYNEMHRDIHREQALKRCIALSVISIQLQHAYARLGCNIRQTRGSTVMALYRHKYLPKFKYNFYEALSESTLDYLRQAYYGGRCEVFRYGLTAIPEHSLWYSDRKAAYGAVMTEVELPLPSENWAITGIERIRATWDRWPGVVEATVVVPDTMIYPPLPYRADNGRTIFPVGMLRGHWTTIELKYALDCGCTLLEIHGGIIWTKKIKYLKDIATDIYALRAGGTDLEKSLSKALLVALSGKWAQQSGNIVKIHRPNQVVLEPGMIIDLWPDDDNPVFALEYADSGTNPPNHVNVIWSSIINAGQRIDLHKQLTKQPTTRTSYPIYCDTDGIIGTTPIMVPRDNEAPTMGDWTVRSELQAVECLAAKAYKMYLQNGRIETVLAGATPVEAERAILDLDEPTPQTRRAGFSGLFVRGDQEAAEHTTYVRWLSKAERSTARTRFDDNTTIPRFVGDPEKIIKRLRTETRRAEQAEKEFSERKKELLRQLGNTDIV